jgi:hypothetical protein
MAAIVHGIQHRPATAHRKTLLGCITVRVPLSIHFTLTAQ